MYNVHVLCAVVEYRCGIEVTLSSCRFAATEHLCALFYGVVHLGCDAFECCFLYERTHVNVLVDSRIAEADSLELLHDDVGELFLHVLVHINALCIVANLARVADAALQNGLGCQLKVSIWEDDGRSLTAQFERYFRDVGSSGLHDLHACAYRTSQTDDAYFRMAGQSVADERAFTCHDIEQSCRKSAFIDDFAEFAAVFRCDLCRFDDDRTARDEGSRSLACNEEEREVPRQNASSHANRFLHENHGLVGCVALNHFTLDTACKFCHVIEVSSCDTNLGSSQSLRLSLLADKDFLELVEVGTDAVGHLVQVDGALGSGHLCPFLLSNVGSFDGFVHVFHRTGRLTARYFLRTGVQNFNPLA